MYYIEAKRSSFNSCIRPQYPGPGRIFRSQLQVSVYYCRKEKNNKSENFNPACIFAAKANIDLMLKYRIDKPGHNVLLLLVTLLHP